MLELLNRYDTLLLDLDGTIFAGDRLIPGAVEGIADRGRVFVTNNASRSPEEVVAHLGSLGISAVSSEVLTSAQAAATLAAETMAKERPGEGPLIALVVGSQSLRDLTLEAGFELTDSADDAPDVVLQGHSPENNWARLSEATLAITRGARYIASNLDTTLPSSRGFLVGNGSMVAAVVSATGVQPLSAGKPQPAMFHVSAREAGSSAPLVVGDRLDTDIAGGRAAEMDTLMVLTGVSTHWDVIHTGHRPTHIRANLSEELGGWTAEVTEPHTITITAGENPADGRYTATGFATPEQLTAAAALAAAAPLAWELLDAGTTRDQLRIIGRDPLAADAIAEWRD